MSTLLGAELHSRKSRPARTSVLGSSFLYVRESFSPRIHVPVASLWYAAAWAGARRVSNAAPVPSLTLLVGVAHAFFMLLALRIVDDLKDLDYDRTFHPERPLASGRVRPTQALGLLGLVSAGLLALDLLLGWPFVVLAAAQLAFAVLMASWRMRGRFLAEHWLAEVILIQPANILLTVHAFLLGTHGAGTSASLALVPLGAAFSATILQLEVARKTAFDERPGEDFYSSIAGPRAALGASFLLAACASLALAQALPGSQGLVATVLVLACAQGTGLAVAASRKSRRIAQATGAAFAALVFVALVFVR